MKEIATVSKHIIQVDDEDFEFLSQFKWNIRNKRPEYGNNTNYAFRYRLPTEEIGPRFIAMHRQITNAPKNMYVDHIDGNGLNNQRSNLRLCTPSENSRNTSSRAGSTSKYLGVCLHKSGKWQASIKGNGKFLYLGLFCDEIDAALAYNEAAKIHHGEFARLNIIE